MVKKKTSEFGLKKQHQKRDTNAGLLHESPGLFDPSTTPNDLPVQISAGDHVTSSERWILTWRDFHWYPKGKRCSTVSDTLGMRTGWLYSASVTGFGIYHNSDLTFSCECTSKNGQLWSHAISGTSKFNQGTLAEYNCRSSNDHIAFVETKLHSSNSVMWQTIKVTVLPALWIYSMEMYLLLAMKRSDILRAFSLKDPFNTDAQLSFCCFLKWCSKTHWKSLLFCFENSHQ